jgi:hypothetical protein
MLSFSDMIMWNVMLSIAFFCTAIYSGKIQLAAKTNYRNLALEVAHVELVQLNDAYN